ncbi:capsular polysaccharide biosynthesis protein [Roseicyclus sp. F158]|uniref:Capsular polysaccharide biosynthesis protein n=1 Tax=Tropicimonas omnivorans TaxID=3075590 RepID=A0ABU3DH01_9RHOB|nr:capsular polysaccharide biosynthesis protein [Roseicyclus sp. F158]MDT0682843.1 capsular polysaccharide biosynthesis protein [Roseicyclus sp. F158]
MTEPQGDRQGAAVSPEARRLFVYNGGFLAPRIRRILASAGWRVTTGRPGPQDWVGVWGASPTARRGEHVASRTGAKILRVEDALLRSVKLGRDGAPPIGLTLDERGLHFDPSRPSDLEHLLATHPLDDTALLDRARVAMARLREADLSKYSAHDPALEPPEPGYVLVIDQTAGDASLGSIRDVRGRFAEMLGTAQIEHPGARILLKVHPETLAGRRAGHFGPEHESGRVHLFADPVSPHRLLDGAIAVYTVSSGLGFEAIMAGHRPVLFGQPFYAGWGLTEDAFPVDRRQRRLTRAQLFAAAMILHPVWYDPCRRRRATLEEAIDQLEAEARAYREDREGHVALGMRLWKRGHLQRFFGRERRLRFAGSEGAALKANRPILAWAGTAPAIADRPLRRVEDGFLRSRGLGAELVPPLSLVSDDLGIYYDPGTESRLERLISASASLPPHALARAERLAARITKDRLTKYNTGGAADLPERSGRRVVVVPGQVEDDASIRLGAGDIRTNRDCLAAARAAHPDALLIYKPHPDVEAGLRIGAVPDAAGIADVVASRADPASLIDAADEVWTMTSLMGFEALLRGRAVTVLGAPFYAGWGLTRDLGPVPARRTARPALAGLIHATLIGYPRYLDPVSSLPCPPEIVAERLAAGTGPRTGPALRLLSKAQGVAAGLGPFWR